jgi:Rrf2 family protein
MRVSAKAEYACIAVLELATNHGRAPVSVKQIAQEQNIPQGFLVQILFQLKMAGIVTSTRGSGGGYQLSRDPRRVTLADVLTAIDDKWQVDYDRNASNLSPAFRALRSTWQDITSAASELTERVTFADLAERVRAERPAPVIGDWI